jgi:hypothetical protein
LNLAHDIHWMQIVSAYGYGVIFLVIMLRSWPDAAMPCPFRS